MIYYQSIYYCHCLLSIWDEMGWYDTTWYDILEHIFMIWFQYNDANTSFLAHLSFKRCQHFEPGGGPFGGGSRAHHRPVCGAGHWRGSGGEPLQRVASGEWNGCGAWAATVFWCFVRCWQICLKRVTLNIYEHLSFVPFLIKGSKENTKHFLVLPSGFYWSAKNSWVQNRMLWWWSTSPTSRGRRSPSQNLGCRHLSNRKKHWTMWNSTGIQWWMIKVMVVSKHHRYKMIGMFFHTFPTRCWNTMWHTISEEKISALFGLAPEMWSGAHMLENMITHRIT